MPRAGARLSDRLPLAPKLVVPVVLIALVVGSLLAWMLSRRAAEGIRESYDLHARSVATLVASQVARAPDDAAAARGLIADARRESPSILTIRLYRLSPGGRSTLAHSSDAREIVGTAATRRRPVEDMRGAVHSVVEPVVVDGRRIGLVEVATSSDLLGARIRRDTLELLAMVLAAATGAVFLLMLLLHFQVLRRVRVLSEGARRAASGDLDVRLFEGDAPSRDPLVNVARDLDRMLRRVRSQHEQQRAVSDLSRTVLAGTDRPMLIEAAAAMLNDRFGADRAAVFEANPDGSLAACGTAGWPTGAAGSAAPAAGPLETSALERGEAVIAEDLTRDGRFPDGAGPDMRSAVAVIVPGPERPFGVVALYAKKAEAFSDDDVRSVSAIADTLGSAIEHLRSQERLEEAELRFRTLVERVPAITYIAEPGESGTWTYVSPQIEAILGFPPDALMRDPGLWHRQLHPDDRDRVIEEERTAADAGGRLVLEYRMLARDGRVVWFRDEAIAVKDASGRTVALQGLMYDVTERWEAERAVREAEERYRALVEQVPAVVYTELPDEGSTCIYASPQIERLVGYTPEEWIADPALWFERVHPEDREEVVRRCADANASGEVFDMDYRMYHRDGTMVWVRDHAVPLRGEDGRIRQWHGLLQDVTAWKQAEAKYRSLVEQLPTVTYVTGLLESDEIAYVSPQLEELIGVPPETWYESPTAWMKNTHPDDLDRVNDAWLHHIATGEPYREEYRVLHEDGRTKWVRDEGMVVRDEDGHPICSQGVMTDITELKQAEAALREGLDREREAGDRLRALDEMKNAFLAAVSHELRTPLSSVLGYAVTLEREDLPLTGEERREMTHRLAVNARKLERLLTDLLDLDRLARGVVDPKIRPTRLDELVHRVVAEAQIEDHPVVVECTDAVMDVDAPKVERIVENLVANAAKHTDPGSTIWVGVKVDARSGTAIIRVDDEGTGVPDDLKRSIFEPFRRGRIDDANPVPGTGIGLSLVARFAELHGGDSWVEDRPEGGSSFRVLLRGRVHPARRLAPA